LPSKKCGTYNPKISIRTYGSFAKFATPSSFSKAVIIEVCDFNTKSEKELKRLLVPLIFDMPKLVAVTIATKDEEKMIAENIAIVLANLYWAIAVC
jgi:hypothetical protein